MVVWINNPFDFLPGEGARLERYALLSQALARAGHDVVWWSSDWSHLEKIWREAPDAETLRAELGLAENNGRVDIRLIHTKAYYQNISFARVRSHRNYARRWRAEAEAAVASGELQRPDRILVSSPPLSLYAEAEKLVKAWGHGKILLDVQDLWPEAFYQVLPVWLRGLGRIFFRPWRRMADHAYQTADCVTVVAESYRERIRRKDARCFPLGIALPTLEVEKATGTLNVCYIGNLGWAYRLETCIEAIRKLSADGIDVQLEVAGEGPQRILFEKAEWEGLPVRFCGLLDAEEYDALLRRNEIGIVPMVAATGVGIPNKICDYAAYGLAIVSGLAGEAQKLIEEFAAGTFYDADDADALARELRNYVNDRGKLIQVRKASRRLAEARFDARQIYADFARQVVAD